VRIAVFAGVSAGRFGRGGGASKPTRFKNRGVRCPQIQRFWYLRRGTLQCPAARILKIIHFFNSRTTLTRESRESTCASGQTWYRKGTELVLTGRKLYVTCTESVLVGMDAEKLARSRTEKRARHAVRLRLFDKLNIVARWGAASSTPTMARARGSGAAEHARQASRQAKRRQAAALQDGFDRARMEMHARDSMHGICDWRILWQAGEVQLFWWGLVWHS
jgi:hypothetical protein